MFNSVVFQVVLYFAAILVLLVVANMVYRFILNKDSCRLSSFEVWIVLAAIWLNPNDRAKNGDWKKFTPINAIPPLENAIRILESNELHKDVRYSEYYKLLLLAHFIASSSGDWGVTKTYIKSKDILERLVKVEVHLSEDNFYSYHPIIPNGLLDEISIRERKSHKYIKPTNLVPT